MLSPNMHTYVYIVTKSVLHIKLVYMLIIINVIMIIMINVDVYAGKRIATAGAVVRLSS